MRGTNCRELATLTLSGLEVVINEETRFFSFGIFSNNRTFMTRELVLGGFGYKKAPSFNRNSTN